MAFRKEQMLVGIVSGRRSSRKEGVRRCNIDDAFLQIEDCQLMAAIYDLCE